jgi:hypothetical protein
MLDLFRILGNYVDNSSGVEFRRGENPTPEITGHAERRFLW